MLNKSTLINIAKNKRFGGGAKIIEYYTRSKFFDAFLQ